MRREETLRWLIVIVFILFFAVNINGINNFLSFNNDKTVDFGHSATVVPQGWNTTDELNLINESKTEPAISNGYIFIDHWDDWPENSISSISQDKFKSMEDGKYEVLKNENCTLNGIAVSKQYFSNPSRDNFTVWNHIGVNYVFSKEDTNYTVQVHYFTDQDYNNTTFMKEIDSYIEEDIPNIHNNRFNEFVSNFWHGFDDVKGNK